MVPRSIRGAGHESLHAIKVMMIETERLILRPWRDSDLDDLARMCGDPAVMVDYPAPQTREDCVVRLTRYRTAFEQSGFTRWALFRRDDATFVGYTGIQPVSADHPLAQLSPVRPVVEIGWRLVRAAWGHGLATEAARASLEDGFSRCGFGEVLSYTTPRNERSQAVMRRIALSRRPTLDFSDPDGNRYIVFGTAR